MRHVAWDRLHALLVRVDRVVGDQRQQDRGPAARRRGWRILVRENWYRDVWLVAVTVISMWAVLGLQHQRREAIRVQCRDQNVRHDDAVHSFLTSPLFRSPKPLSKEQEAKRVETTKEFVKVILPRRDCDKQVRRLAP